MEDSYSQRDKIWKRMSTRRWRQGKESKPANKRTQEPTLASKMDRVVSICCMRRDMLASFCRGKREDVRTVWNCKGQKMDPRQKCAENGCTNLFTNDSKSVDKPHRVHHKLVEKGNDSSLLNSGDLKETHVRTQVRSAPF